MPYTPDELKRMKEYFGLDKEGAEVDSGLEGKVSEGNGLVVASGSRIYCVNSGRRF